MPAAELDEGRARVLCLLRACEEGPVDAALWSPEDAVWASRLADETVDQRVDRAGDAAASPAAQAGQAGQAARSHPIHQPGPPAAALAAPALWLAERARHAREHLLPRHAALARAYARRAWSLRWVLGAALVGGVFGLLADMVGGTQHIDLLAAPVWAVVAWNLLVYGWIALRAGRASDTGLPTRPGLLRRAAQRWFAGWVVDAAAGHAPASSTPPTQAAAPLRGRRANVPGAPEVPQAPDRRFVKLWAETSAPLAAGRAALLLHVAAAALALGLVAGLYARALVLDYRASWQSTLLNAEQVHGLLSVLLAPASGFSGIAVPDAAAVAALRAAAVGSAMVGGAAASPAASPLPSAVPWLHLLAATLVWAVVVPRLLLALLAAWATARRARHLPVIVDDAHSLRLLQMRRRGAAGAAAGGVQVLPHGFVPAPAATLALRALLAACFGESATLQVAPSTAYGDEERTPGPAAQAPAGGAWRIAWFELATTPEPQVQGRFIEQLRAQGARRLVVLVDEGAFRQRLGATSPRLRERRALWHSWGDAAGVGVACVDLQAAATDAHTLAAARAELEAALEVDLLTPAPAAPDAAQGGHRAPPRESLRP